MLGRVLFSISKLSQIAGFAGVWASVASVPAAAYSSPSPFTGRTIRMGALIAPGTDSPSASPSSKSSPAPAPSLRRNRSSTPSLVPHQPIQVPSFAAEINTYAMSSEMVAHVEATYAGQMKLFAISKGLDLDYLGRGDPLSRDRGSLRPFLLSPESEIAVRTQMAYSVRDYMLDTGLKRMLSEKEASKRIVKAVHQVENAARVEVKTDKQWAFSAGFNPFTFGSFAAANHPLWSFSINTDFDTPKEFKIVGTRRWQKYSFTGQYHNADGTLRPKLGYQVSPSVSTIIGATYSLANFDPFGNSYHEVGLSYSF